MMVHGCSKKQWVVPVLEKIEMAQTRVDIFCGGGTGSKNKTKSENPQANCSAGS